MEAQNSPEALEFGDVPEVAIDLINLRHRSKEALATLAKYAELIDKTGKISKNPNRECDIDGLRLRIETALHANLSASYEEIAYLVADALHFDLQNHSIRVAQKVDRNNIPENLVA